MTKKTTKPTPRRNGANVSGSAGKLTGNRKRERNNTEDIPLNYDSMDFKIPMESADYEECSDFVVERCEAIVKRAIDEKRNRIIINMNLRLGLPMENINKVAGPFVEAWAYEVFFDALNDGTNEYQLVNVEAQHRLTMSDVILQFERTRPVGSGVTAEVDVKLDFEMITMPAAA